MNIESRLKNAENNAYFFKGWVPTSPFDIMTSASRKALWEWQPYNTIIGGHHLIYGSLEVWSECLSIKMGLSLIMFWTDPHNPSTLSVTCIWENAYTCPTIELPGSVKLVTS